MQKELEAAPQPGTSELCAYNNVHYTSGTTNYNLLCPVHVELPYESQAQSSNEGDICMSIDDNKNISKEEREKLLESISKELEFTSTEAKGVNIASQDNAYTTETYLMKIGVIGNAFNCVSAHEQFVLNLVRAGLSVSVYFCGETEGMFSLLSAGAIRAETLSELIYSSDIIFSCVKDDDTLKELFSNDIYDALTICGSKKTGYIEMTLLNPETASFYYDKVSSTGCPYLHASLGIFCQVGDKKMIRAIAAGNKTLWDVCTPYFKFGLIEGCYVGDYPDIASKLNLVYHMFRGTVACAVSEIMYIQKKYSFLFDAIEEGDESYKLNVIDVLRQLSFASPAINKMVEDIETKNFTNKSSLGYMNKCMTEAAFMGDKVNCRILLGKVAFRVFRKAYERGLGTSDEIAIFKTYFEE